VFPTLLDAVNMYVVVPEGVTVMLLPLTIELLNFMLSAPVTLHANRLLWPEVMTAGEAVNEEITGAVGVADAPPAPPALPPAVQPTRVRMLMKSMLVKNPCFIGFSSLLSAS